MRVVGRLNQRAKRLLRDSLEIVPPLGFDQEVTGAVVDQSAVGKLVSPLNAEGFFPEPVLAFDVEPYSPPHFLTPDHMPGRAVIVSNFAKAISARRHCQTTGGAIRTNNIQGAIYLEALQQSYLRRLQCQSKFRHGQATTYFFTSLFGISVRRGNASGSPVLGLLQRECSRPSLFK